MSDYVIPAIIFRVEKAMPVDDLKAIMTDIKMRTKSWTGDGEFKAVLGYQGFGCRGHVEIGVTVPFDTDGMDEVLLAIPELTSLKRYHAFDMIDGREHAKRWKTGHKALKPKPEVDPANMRHGYDISKIRPGLRHTVEPEARAEGVRFAALLEGFPFTNKTPVQNRDFIEMDVIAVLQSKFPNIYDANIALEGALVRELRVIADPKNQARLPGDWHDVVGTMFQHNHPGAFQLCCQHVTSHLQELEYKERKGDSAYAEGPISDPVIGRASDIKLSNRDRRAMEDEVRKVLSPGHQPTLMDYDRDSALKLALSWGWKVDLTQEDVQVLGHEARRVMSPCYVKRSGDMPPKLAERMIKAWKIPMPQIVTAA